jgi:putative inorganic carbon (HCO3(-)) transporter
MNGLELWIAAGGLVALVALIAWRAEAGVVAFVIALFANVGALAGRFVGQPEAVGAALCGLAAVPVFMAIVVRRDGALLDASWLLMLGFLGAILLSTFGARDPGIAGQWIATFVVEGLLVYWLLLNAVRRLATLRHVVWALVATAALLSALSIYQEVSHDYRQQFGGLAQRNIDDVTAPSDGKEAKSGVFVSERAAGPIGDPNRYAQMLLVVLPLALFRIRDRRSASEGILAAAASGSIAAAFVLTYSRGGMLAAVILTIAALMMGYLRWRYAILGAVAAAVVVVALAPGILARIQTIGSAHQLIADRGGADADGAVRGRMTEMLAAFHVFADHPVVGVGPGHFTPFYSVDYMNDPTIAFRRLSEPRRAHSLYLELAAETGLVGIMAFAAVAISVLVRLRQVRGRWRGKDPELEHLAVAFGLAVMAYLASGLFLQLSFQRYYWMLLGLAGATIHVLSGDDPRHDARQAEEVAA